MTANAQPYTGPFPVAMHCRICNRVSQMPDMLMPCRCGAPLAFYGTPKSEVEKGIKSLLDGLAHSLGTDKPEEEESNG